MDYILALDLGTTAIKVILFDSEGKAMAKSTQEYALVTPSALEVELPVETYWEAFKKGLAEVMAASKVAPSKVKGLGISAQGETLIMADEKGEPLMNAIVWLDNRAQHEAAELAAHFGNELTYSTTGQVEIVPTWPASKILWLYRNMPEMHRKTRRFLLIEDYFIHRLTGKYVCEGSLVCSTAYWDIINKVWWKDMLDYIKVDEGQLPELRESGEMVGPLLPEVARELGLTSETIVATGALDQACGALGAGNIVPGMVSENTGAALAICATTGKPLINPKWKIPCHYHAIPDTYMAHTFTTGGMVLRWFKDYFCQIESVTSALSDIDPYKIMDDEAKTVPAGCSGLVMLPHLQGAMAPESNAKAKGVFYGFTLHHTKPYFIRAIMEAIAFAINRNIDALFEMGIGTSEIRSLGGGSRSAIWNQIKADASGKPIYTMQNEECGSLGAAMLAAKSIGMTKSIEDAVGKMVSVKKEYKPNPDNREVYKVAYGKYKMLYESLVPNFEVD